MIQHILATIVSLQLLKLSVLDSNELMAITFQTFSIHPIILAGTEAVRSLHIVLSVVIYLCLTYGKWNNQSLHFIYGVWSGLILLDFFVSPGAKHAPIFYFSFAMLILLDRLIFSNQAPSNMRRLTILFIYGLPVWIETILILHKLFSVDRLPTVTPIQSFFIYGNFVSVLVGIGYYSITSIL